MKTKLLYLLISASVLAVGCQSIDSPDSDIVPEQPIFERDFVPGALNIKVDETLAQEIENEGSIAEMPGSKVVRLFPDGGQFEERMRREGLHLWYRVTFDKDITLTKANSTLSSVNGVEYVEYRRKIAVNDETTPFNDPEWTKQWHYQNRGSNHSGLIAGCDINVVPAWQRGIVGDEKVVVAVIDGGVDYNHEDLRDNMWTNPETEPKTTYGYNFDAGSSLVTPNDHGTHVAGTIAAINNNGIGVNGIAGGDAAKGIKGVRIMSCQIFSSKVDGEGDFVGAIVWAANHGAVIAQNSWGIVGEYAAEMSDTPQSQKAAIDYFNKYAGCDNDGNQLPDSPMKGGVVIFSAGNDSMEKGFPASYEGCISVASVAGDFTPAYYTNFGDWVDISAPGGDSKKSQEITSTIPDNSYGRMQGTSMACPHVSGVAALIVSEFGGPGFTREMCIERLLSTTTPFVSSLKIGRGIVNASDAVAHYGEYLPNNAGFAGYEAKSATSLSLDFIVPEMNYDVKCRTLKVFVGRKAFKEPLASYYTLDFASHKPGDTVPLFIDNLEMETEYFVSTIGVDALGNESALSENITVETPNNNPPVIEPQQGTEVSMKRFMTKSLDFKIYDKDNNLKDVAYRAACAADSFKEVGGLYTLTIEGPKAAPGDYTSTITATDEFGESSEIAIHFIIDQNQNPSVKAIENQIIVGDQQSKEIDLGKYFTHPDGDDLNFTATVSAPVITTNILNASRKMTLRSNGFGYADVTVTATDTFGLTAQCTFKVAAMAQGGYEVYPNPVTDGKLYVRSALEGSFDFALINANGATVRSTSVSNNPFEPYCLNVSDLFAGSYTVRIKGVAGESTQKIVLF